MCVTKQYLKIDWKLVFFNINSFIGQTTYNPTFQEILKIFDILCLTETWHTDDECIKKLKPNIPPEYTYFHNARKNKNEKSKRNSGGIIIFYQKYLEKYISLYDDKTDNMLWIKKHKNNTNLDNDLYLAAIYNSSNNSSYNKKIVTFLTYLTTMN